MSSLHLYCKSMKNRHFSRDFLESTDPEQQQQQQSHC